MYAAKLVTEDHILIFQVSHQAHQTADFLPLISGRWVEFLIPLGHGTLARWTPLRPPKTLRLGMDELAGAAEAFAIQKVLADKFILLTLEHLFNSGGQFPRLFVVLLLGLSAVEIGAASAGAFTVLEVMAELHDPATALFPIGMLEDAPVTPCALVSQEVTADLFLHVVGAFFGIGMTELTSSTSSTFSSQVLTTDGCPVTSIGTAHLIHTAKCNLKIGAKKTKKLKQLKSLGYS